MRFAAGRGTRPAANRVLQTLPNLLCQVGSGGL